MADPVTVAVGRMFYRPNESLVDIGFTGPLVPGGKTMVFKEKADSKNCWYRSGTNADGGVEPAKCLVGEIPPSVAARLRGSAPVTATPSAKVVFEFDPATRMVRVV